MDRNSKLRRNRVVGMVLGGLGMGLARLNVFSGVAWFGVLILLVGLAIYLPANWKLNRRQFWWEVGALVVIAAGFGAFYLMLMR